MGSVVTYPLDAIVIATNTDYLTGPSSGAFTIVKPGQYLLFLSCMAHQDNDNYVHHRVTLGGSHFFQTHDYGSSSSARWTGHTYCLQISLATNNVIGFDAYGNAGGSYLWHDGSSYSQLNIVYLHA